MAVASRIEMWTSGLGPMSQGARRLEDEGWDGIRCGDSQSLAPDCYVQLAVAASVTSTLKLVTSVTNPLTRHPAVTANAIATLQAESGGRAVLGIGRGDSALAYLGLSPAKLGVFKRYLGRVQGYLRGQDVPFDVDGDSKGEFISADELHLAASPRTASRLLWLERHDGLPKVPVDVAAAGPKVIALAAEQADAVSFAVGADPARLRWAVDVLRKARADRGLAEDRFSVGAYVPMFVHEDRAVARDRIAGIIASYARFSVMHGRVEGPAPTSVRDALEGVHASYDMGKHFTYGSPQSGVLTDQAIDTFGIAGPASYCVERILELAEIGITTIRVMSPGFGLDAQEADAAHRRLTHGVLEKLR